MKLTVERLRELLSYDPDTGVFTWLVDRHHFKCKGRRAGKVTQRGYIAITVDYVLYPAHRLAWLYQTGAPPPPMLDHINRVKDDNRWLNLRPADAALNMQNRVAPDRRNKVGFRGVKVSSPNSFRASLRIGGRAVNLGSFVSAELAHAAYVAAKKKHYPSAVADV